MKSAKFASGLRKSKRNQQTVYVFRILLITDLAYQQLKARARILIYSNAEFKSKVLTIVSGVHDQILKQWLTKLVDVNL